MVTAQPQGSSVRLKGLTKTYGNVVAVDNVSLDIAPGEFLTLLGPSGSGKTTTLLMVAGLEEPTSGEIFIGDTLITNVPPYQRDVGMVFQSYALFPHMTVFDNVAFSLKMRLVSRAEIQERVIFALDLVKLSRYASRYPRQLSGGEQQRVALARAIVFNPLLLLMDEPLGALDKKLREHMQIEVKHLQDRLGITVIYVTHDQEEALTMSTRVAVMNQGRIEQVGTPEDLYERPANRFVGEFIGETNVFAGQVLETDAIACRVIVPQAGAVWVPAADDLFPGRRVTLAIRPEKLAVLWPGETPANSFDGSIEEIIYIGEMIKYMIRVAPDLTLSVKRQNRSLKEKLRPGDRIRVGWSVEDTRVVNVEE